MDHRDVILILGGAWGVVVLAKWLLGGHLASQLERHWPNERREFRAPSLIMAIPPIPSSQDLNWLLLTGRFVAFKSFRSSLSTAYILGASLCWLHVAISALVVAIPVWCYVLYPAFADIHSRA